MNKAISFIVITLLIMSGVGVLRADDTEIYRSQFSGGGGSMSRPKVLIIFDNSLSMTIFSVTSPRTDYDPTTTYATQGDIDSDRIYWSKDDDGTPDDDTDNYFPASSNRCASSTTALGANGVGFYQDKVLSWQTTTTRVGRGRRNRRYITTTSWEELDNSSGARATQYMDCHADVTGTNPNNPGTPVQSDGYPTDTSGPYGATAGVSWSGDSAATLYSANYMNWYHNASLGGGTRTRLAVAKDVVTDIIEANVGVDFGMMVFNENENSHDGGRVIFHLASDMTNTQRAALITTTDGLNTDYSTPLCETTYEAYRYLSGLSVKYGDDDAGATPARDMTAETNSTYNSPLGSCQFTHVILMTDGEPFSDTAANSAIKTLTGETCGDYRNYDGSDRENCLPNLARHLYNTDLDDDSSNGTQKAIMYTIGFATDQQLLDDTADAGGGKYYTATDAGTLTTAFQSALMEILSTSTSFSSPTVAVDTFNRTQSRNEVFMAMFEPQTGDRWPGNIKKLTIGITNGTASLLDKNGVAAIDSSTGHIAETATTYWSTVVDGLEVEEGGAGGLLASRSPGTRIIKTNSGTNSALEAFNSTNLDRDAFGLSTDEELFVLFDVTDQAELNTLLSWASGVDVLDEDGDTNTTTRPWILGDMLHSRPLAINYGALSPFTLAEPDIRLVVGTNAGFLHMFSAKTGIEDWAFFPKELAPVLVNRMDNDITTDHTYGIDSSPVLYIDDVGNDGTISGSDKAWVFFGLRRGGRAYYALNLSTPGTPVFKWKIDNTTTGFSELGESWSEPHVTKVPGVTDPVLIFGGGYDASNKDGSGLATTDSMGRAIYIVNANTGALIWSASPAATSATNEQVTGLEHGIAAQVAILDSNGDGLTDRIYAPDTGGNLWRVDLPSATKSTWLVTHLADFNGGDIANDRRFFNSPDIVRSVRGTMAYDAVILGSGDRTNPVATDVDNRFYIIEDQGVNPSYYQSIPTDAECEVDGAKEGDFRCNLPLSKSALHNATPNDIQDGTDSEKIAAQADLYSKKGWYITLENSGEKSLASSITVNGTIFFTTFSPEAGNVNVCIPSPGDGRLYAVALKNGGAVYDFTQNGGDPTKEDRVTEMGDMILDMPTPHVDETGRIRLLFPAGGGGGAGSYISDPILDTEEDIKRAKGVYWYQEEY